MEKIIIIMYGAPGCGKGFTSNRLITGCKKYIPEEEIAYISTGDLIREEIINTQYKKHPNWNKTIKCTL